MSRFAEQARIAAGALRANWFRAILTALGVVIGVASLIAVTAVSAGAREDVAESIRRLGANVVIVDGEFITIGTRQSATERTITPADVESISQLPMVSTVAPHQDIESLAVSAGRNRATTYLVGMTPAYADIHNQLPVAGRMIVDADVDFGRKVMVLGLDVRDRLFPDEDPIGKAVRVGNHEFEVIGIQNRKGNLSDENLDNRVFIPLPLATRAILGGVNYRSVNVRVRSDDEIEAAQDAIAEVLRANHKLPESYPDDFST
jgi:ABC-type antimicrobial peptide transport system permease subunit